MSCCISMESIKNARRRICAGSRTKAVTSILMLGRSYAATRFTEVCETGNGTYENRYWLDDRGTVRRSIQWVSPEIGQLQIDRLTD